VSALVSAKRLSKRLLKPAGASGLRPRLEPSACASGLRLPKYSVNLPGQCESGSLGRLLALHT
jgi:hypothetical protein